MIESVKPEVVLVAHTNDTMVPAKAARLCTSTKSVQEILEPFEGDEEILDRVMGYGHTSVAEHFAVTFGVSGISRVTETQLVRHRISSFSIKSGRYTKVGDNFKVVFPKSVGVRMITLANPVRVGRDGFLQRMTAEGLVELCHLAYQALLADGVPPEDARYLLPQATATQLLVTMNARELLHFFEERCCSKAQWEIREVAKQMLQICKELHPTLFNEAGPKCLRLGFCPERESCGLRPSKST